MKYIRRPVISTTVEIAGLATTAGSPPILRTIKGSPAPIIADVMTWMAIAKEIVNAI